MEKSKSFNIGPELESYDGTWREVTIKTSKDIKIVGLVAFIIELKRHELPFSNFKKLLDRRKISSGISNMIKNLEEFLSSNTPIEMFFGLVNAMEEVYKQFKELSEEFFFKKIDGGEKPYRFENVSEIEKYIEEILKDQTSDSAKKIEATIPMAACFTPLQVVLGIAHSDLRPAATWPCEPIS